MPPSACAIAWREPEAGDAERMPRVRGAREQLRARVAVARRRRARAAARARSARAPASACSSPSAVRPLHVQRLGAVRERVQRRAGRLVARAGRASGRRRRRSRPGCAPAPPPFITPVGRADAVERRPLRAGVGRRDVHDAAAPTAADAYLPGVDRGAAADREHAVGARRAPRRASTAPRVHQSTCAGSVERRASARSRSRTAARSRPPPSTVGQLGEAPADDHGEALRANSRNARAARVSDAARRADELDLALELEARRRAPRPASLPRGRSRPRSAR